MNLCVSDPESDRPSPLTGFAALGLVLAFVVLTSGCVFIPTPHYYSAGSRQNLSEQSTNLIRPGVDTIEDVMLKLGEPDAVSPDERRMTYSSQKIIGELIVIGADTDGSKLPDVPQYHFLDLMLDNQGVVTNGEFSKVGTYLNQVWTFPQERIDALLTGSIGGEGIKISSQAEWFPDFGSVTSDPESTLAVLFHGLGHGFGLCRAPRNTSISGWLMLTESTLYFIEATQWLNEQPALSLRYDSLTECRLGNNSPGWGPTLVVCTRDNHLFSFAFYGKAIEPACKLIQTKIKPTQFGK